MSRRAVLVATVEARPMQGLAAALRERSVPVAVLSQCGDPGSFLWDASSREGTRKSIIALRERTPAPSQLVVCLQPPEATSGSLAVDVTFEQWSELTGTAMLQTIQLLQALADDLKSTRASVVFVGASIAMVGAAHLSALVTLQEAQRGLMKSIARQWGAHGVTCNWVAVHACELWPQLEGLSLPKRAEAIPVALGRRPNAAADLAAALDYFWSDGGRAATGITLNLDGGEWMVP